MFKITKYVSRGEALEPAYINNMIMAFRGWGIVEGFEVTEHAAGANLSVDISPGSAWINGVLVTITDVTTLSVTSPSGGTDRYDLIILNSSGTISRSQGIYDTPAYANDYDFDANDAILLAEIYLPNGDTAITDSQITNMALELPKITELIQTYYQTIFEKQASDDLQLSSDTEEHTLQGSAYTELKTFVITVPFSGTVRVKFDIKTAYAGYAVYGKIYKNGVAIGTEQSTVLDTYATKSEDIDFGDVVTGDTISLYTYEPNGIEGYFQNFRLYAANSTTLVNTNVLSGIEG